jgi:hypothetical protein
MKPQKREVTEFEKVKTDDFIPGVIEGIEYDQLHKFKGYGKDEKGNPKQDREAPAVRFKFALEGYKYHHRSKWMGFSYNEKSNLFIKFLVPLVENAVPEMDFDLDNLKGMKVKTLWSEKNDFQTVETIRPAGKKIAFSQAKSDIAETHEVQNDEECPF